MVSEIVNFYIEAQGITLRRFASQLTASLRGNISHATVANWRDGKTAPNTDFLLQMLIAYDDWRQHFALDCLRAKLPEVFSDGQLANILNSLESIYQRSIGRSDFSTRRNRAALSEPL